MYNELMNFDFQVASEDKTQETTRGKIKNWIFNYPKLLDALFEVAYFTGMAKKIESPEGDFYAFGHHILLRFPYTIRATCVLIEKGFYFESLSLVRNLYESFFQLRYFHKHQDKITNHVTNRRIKFKTMFEEIAPGYYDEIYGKQLSEFAHGGFSSLLFRSHYDSPDSGKILMGNQYEERGCTYSLNQVVPILYGILNYIPILFPQYPKLVQESTEKKRKESIDWLERSMNIHMDSKPSSKKFYDLVSPLIRL